MDAFYSYYEHGGQHGLIVVPTAGGKSLIIGGLASEICQQWPGQRILILSHVGELLVQNHSKIMLCWPNAPAGLYSAGLGKRQAHHPIVVAGVQSVYKKADALGHRDLVFIDEAHLLQPGSMGMYGALLKDLMAINPQLKVCGFTATDYRAADGLLTEGKDALFNDVIIEIPIKHLLDEGYITPPIGKASLAQADMAGVKTTAGEFNIKEMAARFDQKAFMNAALDSDMLFFEDRKSIALFCPTVENAQHVADGMIARGIQCEVIDGEMSAAERGDKLERFRSGELRALASVGVITTGTDIPNMDCIVMLRATQSPGLYQQIVGRGFRVVYADGYDMDTTQGRIDAIRYGVKPNFLILDHGGNIERHGPILYVGKPQKREKGERRKVEKAKARICEICRSGWPLEVTMCGTCGSELVAARDATKSLDVEASHADIMGTPFTRGEAAAWFDIDQIRYAKYVNSVGNTTLRITYYSGIMLFNEWKGLAWVQKNWKPSAMCPEPKDVEEAAKWAASHMREPTRVQVVKKKFYEILRHDYNELMEYDHASASTVIA